MTALTAGRVVINGAEVEAFMRRPDGPVSRLIAERGQRVQEAAKAQVIRGVPGGFPSKRTNRLAPHIIKRWVDFGDGPLGLIVGTDVVYYARWVHDGNGPPGGTIWPNPRMRPSKVPGSPDVPRMLRFEAADGTVYYRRSVKTSRANRFLTDNLHLAIEE